MNMMPSSPSNSPRGDTSPIAGTLNARFVQYLDRLYPARALWHSRLYALVGAGLSLGLVAGGVALGSPAFAWLVLPILAAAAVRLVWDGRQIRNTQERLTRQRQIAASGMPVTGYLVEADETLLSPGADDLPCLVLFSFQPEVGNDLGYMGYIARRVQSLKGTFPADPDSQYVASLTAPIPPEMHRRRPLPPSFTDGSTVYCADLWVRRAYLKTGCLTSTRLPCLAEASEGGGIELIPVWLLPDRPANAGSRLLAERE